ncbi:MAG: hypothetical protein RR232_08710, partial [Clostridia bacterium]
IDDKSRLILDELKPVCIHNEYANLDLNAANDPVVASALNHLSVSVMCIIRVIDSIAYWYNERGTNGYISFLREFFRT